MKRFAFSVFLLSVLAAVACLTVNIDIKDVGGMFGTMVVQPSITKEELDQLRSTFKLAGFGWICISSLTFFWFIRILRR